MTKNEKDLKEKKVLYNRIEKQIKESFKNEEECVALMNTALKAIKLLHNPLFLRASLSNEDTKNVIDEKINNLILEVRNLSKSLVRLINSDIDLQRESEKLELIIENLKKEILKESKNGEK